MTIYVDNFIVSFNVNDKYECEYILHDIKYCPNCQICRDINYFRSLNKSKEYNKSCRRCLNSINGYKGFKREVFKNL